jgi:hypothetical protein
MITRRHSFALFATALGLSVPSLGAPSAADPCAKVAGLTFVPPNDALACLKSFPFNETLKNNVINAVARVFDFYTFEDWYLNSPPPFQESTANIRDEIAKINATKFEVGLSNHHRVSTISPRKSDRL